MQLSRATSLAHGHASSHAARAASASVEVSAHTSMPDAGALQHTSSDASLGAPHAADIAASSAELKITSLGATPLMQLDCSRPHWLVFRPAVGCSCAVSRRSCRYPGPTMGTACFVEMSVMPRAATCTSTC